MAQSLKHFSNFGLALVASSLMEPIASAAETARNVSFDGNPLWIVGIVAAVVLVFWVTCIGALRSDRRDRTLGRRDRGGSGSVYADVDGDGDDAHHHIGFH